MYALLVGAAVVVLGIGAGTAARAAVRRPRVPCVVSHSENQLNYPWLRHIHGGVDHIDFEEPVGSGHWRRYDDHWWAVHCRVISHKPADLAQSHIRAFVDPATRFARLAFYFRDGTVAEPMPYWYQLEADWFRTFG